MRRLDNLRRALRARASESPLVQRWEHLPGRDRLALVLLGLFVALLLCYLLIWQPIVSKVASARVHHDQQYELYQYLLQNAAQARQSQQSANTKLTAEQFQGVVTSSAQQSGLVLERFDNDGGDGLQISLAQAPFSGMMRWLLELQEKGVSLSEVNLEKTAEGRVDARLTLRLGSHSGD